MFIVEHAVTFNPRLLIVQEQNSRLLIFQRRLNELMEQKGVNGKELAQATGITAAAISNYRRGQRLAQAEELAALGAFFGCPIEGLITEPARRENPVEERVLEAHDHAPTHEYISTTAAHEALDKLSVKNRGLCKLFVDLLVRAERLEAQKRKRKR